MVSRMRLQLIRATLALVTLLAASAAAFADGPGQVKLSGDERQLAHFNNWANQIGPKANPAGKIKKVLYPLGNADVVGAFTSFTGPKGGPNRLVIVDAFPYGSPQEVQTMGSDQRLRAAFYGSSRPQHGYVWTVEFQNAIGTTGPAIHWELQTMGATNIETTYLDASGNKRKPPTRPRKGFKRGPDGIPYYDRNNRDFVEVRFTLNGVERSILYIQHDVTAKTVPPILRHELDRGFDAILQKAAFTNMGRAWAQGKAFVDSLLPSLDSKHGVFLTDQVRSAGTMKDLKLPAVKFGYSQAYLYRPLQSGSGVATALRAQSPKRPSASARHPTSKAPVKKPVAARRPARGKR